MLEGTASVRIAGNDGQAGAGDAIVGPAGAGFELANAGTGPLRLLCCLPVGGQARPVDGQHLHLPGATRPGRRPAPGQAVRHRLPAAGSTACTHRLQARGMDLDLRPAFGFALLAARDQPTSVTELAGLMGITKQAASKLVDAMISGGYIQRGTDPHDGRQRPVSLTGRGEELLSAVEQVYAELEDRWAKLIGTSHVDRMRRDLMHVLSDPSNGQLPPVRPP